jgi:hypothetical protein
MAVIASLDGEREPHAEGIEHVARPWAEREQTLAGVERPRRGLDAPVPVGAVERARVAGERDPAERRKARGVGASKLQGVAHARRAGPVHGAIENPGECRLECKRPVAVECHGGDAKISRKLELSRLRREGGVSAVELEPAAAVQVTLGAGFGGKCFVLGDGAREQRPHRFCRFDQP